MKLASYNWNFKIASGSTITLTDQPIFQSGEEGKRVWEGGIIFSRFAAKNSALFRDKRILELGAGGGISGIALLKYTNISHVLFTDYKDTLFSLIKKNLEENALKKSHKHITTPFKPTAEYESLELKEDFKEDKWKTIIAENPITSKVPVNENCVLCNKDRWGVRKLDWTDPLPKEMVGMFDVIVGSDIIYVGSHHDKLHALLRDISRGSLMLNL